MQPLQFRRALKQSTPSSPEAVDTLEPVGARTDTSLLPLHTSADTDPYIGHDPNTVVADAFTSLFGQDNQFLPITTSGPFSTFVPPFGQRYVPIPEDTHEPPRYSMPEFSSSTPTFLTPIPTSSTGAHPNIAIREQLRRASSVELGKSTSSRTRGSERKKAPPKISK